MVSNVSDAGAFLDPDASRDYLRSWRDDAERKAERAGSMAAQIEQLRTSATDDDNLAEVTVDSAGVLVDLVLTERIHRHEPQVVAQAVMSALQKARIRTAERARDIAVEAMGPDSMSAQVDVAQLHQHASNVRAVRDQLGAIKGASQAITQDHSAYGLLCGWISAILEGRHRAAEELFNLVDENLRLAAEGITDNAASYEATEHAMHDLMTQLGERLS